MASRPTPIAPDGRALIGRIVRLDQARDDDAEGLFEALDDDQVWAMAYSANRPRAASATDWLQSIQLAREDNRIMYVVRLIDPDDATGGRIVGTTSLGDIDVGNEKAHIGWTAYSPSVWSTAVNPECKLLLLRHSFEDCGLGRVKLRTDLINTRSQAAIAKLGATREGIARRHIKRADGSWRSSVIYSVIIDDWPQVRAGLESRVAAFASPAAK
ncbi:MAG TPA: GNAT family protein [Mycobacteriales bacterium]|jgi:RimJ/RimL family protein N-acetyltransferase|nr:GNAT family protein [Mycobacteriales bacterium]